MVAPHARGFIDLDGHAIRDGKSCPAYTGIYRTALQEIPFSARYLACAGDLLRVVLI